MTDLVTVVVEVHETQEQLVPEPPVETGEFVAARRYFTSLLAEPHGQQP